MCIEQRVILLKALTPRGMIGLVAIGSTIAFLEARIFLILINLGSRDRDIKQKNQVFTF